MVWTLNSIRHVVGTFTPGGPAKPALVFMTMMYEVLLHVCESSVSAGAFL